MKKLTVLLLTGVMVLSLAACGGKKEDEDNIGTHLLISPAIRLGIGYYISSERII